MRLMKDVKRRLKNKESIKYLEEIISRKVSICNPTELDIPKFGKVTATSMVNYHVYDGNAIPYFNFEKKKGISGEFTKENSKYFITSNGKVVQ